jgi:hypothetical protein
MMKKREMIVAVVLLCVFSVGAFATEMIIKAGDDTYTTGASSYVDRNWNTAANMLSTTAKYFGDCRVWLKFDLSDLVPAAGFTLQVNSVALQTNGGAVGDLAPAYQDTAYFVSDDSWSESTITWSNQPASSSVGTAQLVTPWSYVANSGWTMSSTGAGLTAAVATEVAGDQFLSMQINGVTPAGGFTSGLYGHKYQSNDAGVSPAYGPQIVVDYDMVPVPEPVSLSILIAGGLFGLIKRRKSII